ncbi:MAG: 50S ribosomal protein L13 [Candidatus Kapabacteria bacterium]|nr:50S ribosomal protein L13 [Candidatus Kapabacteria bacterium]
MNQHGNITRSVREQDVQRDWLVVDAANCTVGRLATQIATLLRGKHKALFTPHVDCGDFVIVINADKVVLEGKRAEQKEYFHNTGYPGGGRMRSFSNIMKSKPEEIVELAVKGMLPKNSLGRSIVKKLKVYSGSEHPHSAQQPKNYELPYLHLGTK